MVECGESVRRPACVGERQAQGGQHISFALGRAGPAGQTQRGAQLTDPRIDITDIAQNDPRGLMGHRGLIRAGPPRQHSSRPG